MSQKNFMKLQITWKLIHLPSVYILTHWLICPHNALEFHLKLFPGFQAFFQSKHFKAITNVNLTTLDDRSNQNKQSHYLPMIQIFSWILFMCPLNKLSEEISSTEMILRTGTRINFWIWFLPTYGISSCGISQGEIILVNWLLCYRFFLPGKTVGFLVFSDEKSEHYGITILWWMGITETKQDGKCFARKTYKRRLTI